jgi:predicted ATP-binding protein involved in virulence
MKNVIIAQDLEDVDRTLDMSRLTDDNFDHYYIDTSAARGDDPVARIARKFKRHKSKNLKILLTGFQGTGKTTELKRLERELKDDYHVIRISAREKIGRENSSPAELPLHMMLEIIKEFGPRTNYGTAFQKEIGKYFESMSGSVLKDGLPGKFDVDIPNYLEQLVNDLKISSRFLEFAEKNTMSLLSISLQCFDLLLEEFYERVGGKRVLFILDNMEKITLKVAEDILINHIREFSSRDCSYIFTFPIPLQARFIAGTIMHEFDDNYFLPMLKVHDKNGDDYKPAVQCLINIVNKRISAKLISNTLLKQFIRMSGGAVRDLFRMLKIAADNALGRDVTKIAKEDFDYALNKIKSEYADLIVYNEKNGMSAREYYRILVDCYNSKDKKPLSEKGLMDLKLNNTLLGYETDTWYDVHPIVREILIDKGLVPQRRIPTGTEQKSMGLPPITLKSLKLHNIKCFKDVDFSISPGGNSRPWSLFVGDNGVGKSTILHCIALCSLGPDLVSQLVRIPRDMLRVGADKGYMEAVFDAPMETTAPDDSPNEVKIRLTIEKGSRTFGLQYPDDKKAGERVKDFLNARKRTDFEGWFVAAYGPVRNLLFTEEASKLSQQDPIIDRLGSLFDPAKLLIDPASLNRFLSGDTSVFREMDAPEKLNLHTVNHIRELLDKLLPMISFRAPNGKGNLETPFGHVPISELSEGYKSMLSWLAHLLMHLLASVKWEGNINDIKGIVLIDEVDLHLHPQWQRQVIPWLRESFPNMQFICCTHAPMTAGGAKDGDIILLKQEEEEIRIRQDLPSIKGWRADQILTSQLFGLEATRDVDTEKEMESYIQLLGKTDPTDEEKQQLRVLEKKLGDRIPPTCETQLERDAYQMIENTMKSYLDRNEKLQKEVKRQLKHSLG